MSSDRTGAFGVSSMVAPLQRVAMRAPGAILTADHERWHYAAPIDAVRLSEQYRTFADLVAASGAEILWFADDPADDLADSVFTYDPSFVIPAGAILLRPGKGLRSSEANLHAAFYKANDVPIVGRIEPPGVVEGGDLFWIDSTTLAAGRGFRSNAAGLAQLSNIVAQHGITVEVYDLPYHHGAQACLHLLSVISPLDVDVALVHAPLLPTALYQRLIETGYTLVAAPPADFEASFGLNLNVLAVAPRRVIAVNGFPATIALMREAGCEVTTFDASALCLPCEGGPTCLTRPILRS